MSESYEYESRIWMMIEGFQQSKSLPYILLISLIAPRVSTNFITNYRRGAILTLHIVLYQYSDNIIRKTDAMGIDVTTISNLSECVCVCVCVCGGGGGGGSDFTYKCLD